MAHEHEYRNCFEVENGQEKQETSGIGREDK
jgi:hypothetical protein